MIILLNILSSVSGGAEAYLKNMLVHLPLIFNESNSEHSLFLLAHENQRPLFQTFSASQCIVLSGSRPTGLKRLLWERLHLNHIVKQLNADVLFTPYQIGITIPATKTVLMFRNMDPFTFNNYPHTVFNIVRKRAMCNQSKASLKNADRIIAVSNYVQKHAIDNLHINSHQLKLIYHGRDSSFSPIDNDGRDESILTYMGITQNFILTCGSLWPYRRCEDVIIAFSKNNELKKKNLQLIIAGTGTDRRYLEVLNRTIANSVCKDKIKMIGHVSPRIMQALYRHSTACVIASEVEACPNIAIEAMSSGCAIVSSNCQPLPEMLSGCSLEFTSRDTIDLSHKLTTILENQDIRDQLKANALKRADAFSWEKCAAETYSALVNW